jgi:hypothetical protein
MLKSYLGFCASLTVAVLAGGASGATIYHTVHGSNGGPTGLATVDTVTGTHTFIGDYGLTSPDWTGKSAFAPDGKLYSIIQRNSGQDQLGTFNLSTGLITPTATLSSSVEAFEIGSNGVAYGSNNGGPNGILNKINLTTGVLTQISTLAFKPTEFAMDANDTLWAADGISVPTNVYTIDTATGAATFKFTISGLFSLGFDLSFDASNNMYVCDFVVNSKLYLLNKVTGAATLIGSTSGMQAPTGGDIQLIQTVPEPAGLAAMLLSFGLCGARRARRVSRRGNPASWVMSRCESVPLSGSASP